MSNFLKGSKGWIENPEKKQFISDKEEQFLLVSIIELDEKKGECEYKVINEKLNVEAKSFDLSKKKKEEKIKFEKIIPVTNDTTISHFDILKLENVGEVDILNNIRNRYNKKSTFTKIGNLLISVNPYQNLDILSNDKLKEIVMSRQTDNEIKKLDDSSIYTTFAGAMNQVFKNKINQCFILNGETGNGKTSLLKYFYNYLFHEFSKENIISAFETMILNAQTIIEAFGNAKTLKNENSTRSNNAMTAYIDTDLKQLIGLQWESYNFDKNRISECNEGERVFHIFYQILKGGGPKLLETLSLTADANSYKFLSVTKCLIADPIKDDLQFKQTENALINIGFSEDEISNIFKICASILFLGNITFKDAKGAAAIQEKTGAFTKVAKLLEISPDLLETILISNVKIISEKSVKTNLKSSDAIIVRNLLAAELYNRLFSWIIKKINILLSPNLSNENKDSVIMLEVIDTVGLESNVNNNYETLCSNYIWEKMHNQFITDYIKKEYNELTKEGAEPKSLTIKDNSAIIELFEKPCTGIFSLIDECVLSNLDDKAFFTKFTKIFQNNSLIKFSKTPGKFSIMHPNKEIEYNSSGFIIKHVDEFKFTLKECLFDTKNIGIKYILFNCINNDELNNELSLIDGEKKNQGPLITDNFYIHKLNKIFQNIVSKPSDWSSNHVLCFKSNNAKKSDLLIPTVLYPYIRYYGLHDVYKMLKEYPIKMEFSEFYYKYENTCYWEGKQKVEEVKKNRNNINFKELAINILNFLDPNHKNEIFVGNTKMLLKHNGLKILEKLYSDKLRRTLGTVLSVQRKCRKMLQSHRFSKYKMKVSFIQNFFRNYKIRKSFLEKKDKVKFIQGKIKSITSKKLIATMKIKSIFCQKHLRRLLAKSLLKRMKNSGAFITKNMRRFLYLCRIRRIKDMRNLLFWIFDLVHKKIVQKQKTINSIFIQKHVRAFLSKIKNWDIVQRGRYKRRNYFLSKSSFIIQKIYRGCVQRRILKIKKKSSFKIQRYWRMKNLHSLVKEMRFKARIIQKNLRIFFNMKKLINKVLGNFLAKEAYYLHDISKKSSKFILPNFNMEYCKKEDCEENSKRKVVEIQFKGLLPEALTFVDPKMILFAKILDIDFIISTDEIYDRLWASEYEKIYNYNITNGTPIQQISIGGFHTLALNNKGVLFSWGWNNHGQCGISTKSSIDNEISIPILKKDNFNHLETFPARYSIKSGKAKNSSIGAIKQVICSDEYSLIVDNNNDAYIYRNIKKGQKVLGNTNQLFGPTLITELKGKVKFINSSGDMNIALTTDNEIFVWDNLYKSNPSKIIKKVIIISVACGDQFSLILSQQGVVFSFGSSNKFGQLGLGNKLTKSSPEPVSHLIEIGEKISQIACGFKHSVAKTTSGKVFSWGLNSDGQLGVGNLLESSVPKLVILDKIDPILVRILQVTCSYRTTFFLTDCRKVLVCGSFNDIIREKLPLKFNLRKKHPEISDEWKYSIVKIVCSWNKSFSIFYSIISDIRDINKKIVHRHKVNLILNNLASKWETDSMDPPYIESISGYFTTNCMKKPDELRKDRNNSIEKGKNRKKSL